MFKGVAEVSYCCGMKDGETVLSLRVPRGAALSDLKVGDRVQVSVDRPTPPKPAPGIRTHLAALAGRWCNDADFQRWLASTFPAEHAAARESAPHTAAKERDVDRDIAAVTVREACSVLSRSEFDSDANAAARFNHLIRLPYNSWLTAQDPQVFEREEIVR